MGCGRKLLLQGTGIVSVDLDGIEGICPLGKCRRQRTSTWPDLKYRVIGSESGALEDTLNDERIAQKNLPEAPPVVWDLFWHALSSPLAWAWKRYITSCCPCSRHALSSETRHCPFTTALYSLRTGSTS